MANKYLRPAGTGVITDITPEDAGWGHSGLKVVDLNAGDSLDVVAADFEFIVLPLSGSATVEVESETYTLNGRTSVFDSLTDWLYVGLGKSAKVVAT
ncbi:MAG: 5-deoxy-glucuronate isomerase, partial [Actinomycetota bacterium]